MKTPKPSKKIFISYAHDDKSIAQDFLDRLQRHLQAAKHYHYDLWRDHLILPGENWREEIEKALDACDFGLLLTSPAFFASDFIREHELSRFVPDAGKELGAEKRAIPVGLVRYNFGLIDTKGLTDQQIFRRDDGKFYNECAGNGRDRFVNDLFTSIVKLTGKYA